MKRTLFLLFFSCLLADAKPRARDLGIDLEGTPGKWNAITDVKGVEVGHDTIRSGKGRKGELTTARTGVTVIFPAGKKSMEGVPGAWATLNANGEATGVSWLEESGMLEGPIGLTNTQSIGVVRDAIVEWVHKHYPTGDDGLLPVVGETDDSWLNDLYGFHVKKGNVFRALEAASSGVVEEGCVGAGTGTVAFQFKAGIGTASRLLDGSYTLGVLVQSNFGRREDLHILGIPVGKELASVAMPTLTPLPRRDGSIVVILATDAPFLPHQLKRLVKRVSLGIGKLGGIGRNTSGDFFIGFSTAKPEKKAGLDVWKSLPNDRMDAFFEAAVQATEEAILNSLIAAEDSGGINGNHFSAIPKQKLLYTLSKFGRPPVSADKGR